MGIELQIKYKFLLAIFTTIVLTFSGCIKDEIEPNASAVVIKYEIVSSDLILVGTFGSLNYNINLYYTNESGDTITENVDNSFKTWTKEVTVTTSKRPITVLFRVNGMVESLSAKIKMNVYKNGSLVGTFDCPIQDIGFPAFQFMGRINNVKIE